MGRPLREGVGRNPASSSWDIPLALVALYARAWVEIPKLLFQMSSLDVALYARAWVEMFFPSTKRVSKAVALYARAWVEILS